MKCPLAAIPLLVCCLVASAPGAAAQQPLRASAFLPRDSWISDALRRLDDLGALPPGYDAAIDPPSRERAEALLRSAAQTATGDVADLASGYLDRFQAEFPGSSGRAAALTSAWLDAGYRRRSGEVLAGIGYDNSNDWTGVAPAPRVSTATADVRASAVLGRHLALAATGRVDEDGLALPEGYATLDLGTVGFWGGRRALGFEPGLDGGIVLTDVVFDGGGLFLDRPVRLPGFLRVLGPVGIETFLSRVENGDRVTDPWFWALRLSAQPHPRLSLGISRADFFGGRGNTPITLRYVTEMLVGIHSGISGEFNDETLSVDARWRPPLGPALPLELYLEWGMDDSAGGWIHVPARVIGSRLAAVPGLPWLELGVEHTRFAASCCGNTIWYRNWLFRGGWTDARQPLGHPLGGEGSEWLARAGTDLMGARLRLRVSGYLRDRGPENLFAPQRVGHSRGARLVAALRVERRIELIARGERESGDGWARTDGVLSLRWLLAR